MTYRTNTGGARRMLTEEEVCSVRNTYRRNVSMEVVAREHGVSRTLVDRILRESGEPIRDRGRTQQSKLDRWIDRQLLVEGPTILERRKAGATFPELAKLYGVSTAHMRRHVGELTERRGA